MVLTKPINIVNGPFTNYQMFVKDIVKNVKLQFCKLDKAWQRTHDDVSSVSQPVCRAKFFYWTM